MAVCAALRKGEIFFNFNRTLFQDFMVASVALTKGGEIFSPSIKHCFKALMICILNKEQSTPMISSNHIAVISIPLDQA